MAKVLSLNKLFFNKKCHTNIVSESRPLLSIVQENNTCSFLSIHLKLN